MDVKRYENNVYSELPTVLAGEYAEVLSVYTDNDGNKAVIPPGWTVSRVPKENTIFGKDKGLVIYRIPKEKVSSINWSSEKKVITLQKTYDQMTWVPVGLLKANGTLDGVHFNEKFGRRNYQRKNYLNYEFSDDKYHETFNGKLVLQYESVRKYGGFYISRYNIICYNFNFSNMIIQSIRGVYPKTRINLNEARRIAAKFEKSDTITSHLTFGAEYDSVLEWFIESKARTYSEIVENSANWENYYNTGSPLKDNVEIETGSSEKFCTNTIYDFTGNVQEWTQEQYGPSYCDWYGRDERYDRYVIRGGSLALPVYWRTNVGSLYNSISLGLRAILYIKQLFDTEKLS